MNFRLQQPPRGFQTTRTWSVKLAGHCPGAIAVGRVGQRGNSMATLCGMLDWLQALVVKPMFRCHEDECRLPTPLGTRRDGQTGTHLMGKEPVILAQSGPYQ